MLGLSTARSHGQRNQTSGALWWASAPGLGPGRSLCIPCLDDGYWGLDFPSPYICVSSLHMSLRTYLVWPTFADTIVLKNMISCVKSDCNILLIFGKFNETRNSKSKMPSYFSPSKHDLHFVYNMLFIFFKKKCEPVLNALHLYLYWIILTKF